MTFHVAWTPHAEQRIQKIWADVSPDLRGEMLASLLDIATELMLRPNDVGESRTQSSRIAFFLPLVIVYDVDVDRRRVRIAAVKLVDAE